LTGQNLNFHQPSSKHEAIRAARMVELWEGDIARTFVTGKGGRYRYYKCNTRIGQERTL